uniref:Retrovirus-related Pol polyprotein from transposon TNT 1-94 n=1 Tax=Quercus lobata TaxID=97700 RepID=A0A7N2L5Y3_QUELO
MCPINDEEKRKMEYRPYAQVVGSIMYVMLCTRPDLSFAVSLVSRFQSNPDSDFSSNTNDGKCTSGYVFLLGGGVISWLSPCDGVAPGQRKKTVKVA